MLYLPVIVLSFLGWLCFQKTLRRTSLFLMVLAFALHSSALLLRMHISGRPPVTNLYSSAIFIGWAVVVASFIVELFMKNGIGNILGASVGSGTLMIAHYLARDEGDTLQAPIGAAWARKDIDGEHPCQELGPRQMHALG